LKKVGEKFGQFKKMLYLCSVKENINPKKTKIMKVTFIYATNRSQVIYKFRIIDESETEYICLDANTTSYELSQVKFYFNKENLCQARCDEKRWEFIVKEEFFASFELKDVKREFYQRQITLIENENSRKVSELAELEILHNQKVKKTYNNFFSFNDFKLNDKLYVLYEKGLYETKVVSFVTLDKINFVPNINVYFGNTIEDYAELKQRENGELYIDITEHNYDYIDYLDCLVFLTKEDYDTYLEMLEYDNEVERISNYKSSIEWHKRKLEKINKLISEL
jgi:hypothetical protein